MQNQEQYIQKIESFPAKVETLVLFKKNASVELIVIQCILTVILLLGLAGTAFGSFAGTGFSTVLFSFISILSIHTIINQSLRLYSKKNICLAKDQEWLYVDQFNPKKIKIDQIQEIQIIKTRAKSMFHYFLAILMKDGKIVGKDDITWWPHGEIPAALEKQNIKVSLRRANPFYVFKHIFG